MESKFDILGVAGIIVGDLIMLVIVLTLIVSVTGLEFSALAPKAIAPISIFLIFVLLFPPIESKPKLSVVLASIFFILSIISLVFTPSEFVLFGINRIVYNSGAIVSTIGSTMFLCARTLRRLKSGDLVQ